MTIHTLHPDKDPNVILERCKGMYTALLVIGWSKENEMLIDATENLPAQDALWLVEQFKMMLLMSGVEMDD